MNENVIETRDLTVYYGRHRGIIDVNLTVRKGEVFGFLGPNGAGKTTTQRVLLDIIRPTRGSAAIFGLDCQKQGVEIRQRIGYIPGELSMYPNMTGRRYLDLIASLQDGDSTAYRDEICQRLNLDTGRRIKNYSRGNKQKVGVVAAFMTKPALLILDEPTTGLDPLVQQTVMELVLEAKQDARTVFFSSHILSEVQTVCDRVAIIRDGQIAAVEDVDVLTRQQFYRIRFAFQQPPPENAFAFDGVTEVSRTDNHVVLEVRDSLPALMRAAAQYGICDIETQPVTLEEAFLTYYGADSQ
ncbi:MAG: ABC transporter ATP-binding protein [Anaerolineae bacterium]